MESSAPSRSTAPAVVAVVVSHDPGPWFEESLEALASQDYSNLAVLVIDTASTTDPTPRVASVLPSAYVRRLDDNPGFGAAANDVIDIVDGAAFYCFLHDDAAPEDGAIRTLVGEALRSNAGIVGPKLVRWDDTRRLLQVGESADKTGERVRRVEPGELDQEQHDAVGDVFVVPGACTLVRSDLFAELGGFDEGIDLLNEDLDLCWRAHLAGARVVVAPDAVVRHVEALGDRSDVEERRRRLIRHRLRTVLTCYSPLHLVRVLPQMVIAAILEVLYSVVVGRRGQASDVIRAWRWNLRRLPEIRRRRRVVQGGRRVPDREIRRFQVRGLGRLTTFARGQVKRGGHRSDRAGGVVRAVTDAVRGGEHRVPVLAWAVTLFIVGLGSRYLILDPVPAVGELTAFDQGPGELARAYLSSWRTTGLGGEASAPTVHGLLAVAGTLFLGAMGTLRVALLLGALLGGLVGAFRLTRPLDSLRAQAASLVVYGAIPLVYDAIGEARLGPIVAYATLPWLLASGARAAGWAPFGPRGGEIGPGVRPVGRRARIARLSLGLAVAAAFSPAIVLVVAIVAVGFAVGSVAAGAARGVGALIGALAAAVGGAVVLNLPWALEFVLPGATVESLFGQRGAGPELTFTDIVRFDVGPVGGGTVSLGLLAAGLLPLLIGIDWRFTWAVRAWGVVVTSIAVTVLAEQDVLGIDLPSAELLLLPASAGLALAVALGVASFERDLRPFGFGWRQVLSIGAAGLFLLGAIPTLLDAGNGRWYLPSAGLDNTFSFLGDDATGYRILWLGDPDVLPADSFVVGEDLAYATSRDGLPSILDNWSGAPTGATALLDDALELATDRQTNRLGRLLAPMSVRFIVVPTAQAPSPLGGVTRPAPTEVLRVLDAQLDLREVPLNPAYRVYENRAALPVRSILATGAGDGTALDVTADDLAGSTPVLVEETGRTTAVGSVPAGARILHSSAADPDWELLVDGEPAVKVKLFGWADGYETTAAGEAELRHETAPLRYGVVGVQALFWLAALRVALRRKREPVGDRTALPREPTPLRIPEPTPTIVTTPGGDTVSASSANGRGELHWADEVVSDATPPALADVGAAPADDLDHEDAGEVEHRDLDAVDGEGVDDVDSADLDATDQVEGADLDPTDVERVDPEGADHVDADDRAEIGELDGGHEENDVVVDHGDLGDAADGATERPPVVREDTDPGESAGGLDDELRALAALLGEMPPDERPTDGDDTEGPPR